MVTNGIVHPHRLDYLEDESGQKKTRLEKTLPHGNPYKVKNIDYPKGAKHFVIEKMCKSVKTVDKETGLEDALKILEQNKIHHLPVIDDKKIIGVLSDRDLIKLNGDTLFRLISVQDMMAKIVLCCGPETELLDVAKVFVKEMISSMPVIEESGELLGIITKIDLLSALITHEFFD